MLACYLNGPNYIPFTHPRHAVEKLHIGKLKVLGVHTVWLLGMYVCSNNWIFILLFERLIWLKTTWRIYIFYFSPMLLSMLTCCDVIQGVIMDVAHYLGSNDLNTKLMQTDDCDFLLILVLNEDSQIVLHFTETTEWHKMTSSHLTAGRKWKFTVGPDAVCIMAYRDNYNNSILCIQHTPPCLRYY